MTDMVFTTKGIENFRLGTQCPSMQLNVTSNDGNEDILEYARKLVANQPMKKPEHHRYDLEIPSDLHWELVRLGAELKMDYEVYAEEILKMHAEDAISKRIVAKAYADPSWVYKLKLDCVEEEDGTMSINIEWDENDPDLQYWTNLGAKRQEDFILTALRSACNSVLSDHVD